MVRARQRSWVRRLNTVPFPAARLVCFPHSGGTVGSYAWAAVTRQDVQLFGVQYPGRGDRFGEPPPTSVQEMSAHVAAELARLDPLPCALFGHSLGALVAYETAIMLREKGCPPDYLFVSGSPPPRRAGGGRTHLALDDELWSAVRELGGIAPELADNEEFREALLPTLRADITANETYRPGAVGRRPLSCPVRYYHGVDDARVSEATSREWAEISTGPFSLCRRRGGHFHLFVDPAELVDDILSAMADHTHSRNNDV